MAQWFGVKTGPPLKIPLPVFMPQHKDTWSRIRQKYHLKDLPYDHVSNATLRSLDSASWCSMILH